MTDSVVISPAEAISGSVDVVGDKSISHRALMFSALAVGHSTIRNLAAGEDVKSTARVLRQLGVEITTTADGCVAIAGCGFEGFSEPIQVLDCGNSGTTMRLMMGILAGRNFSSTLVGDESLSRRPMGRISTPLEQMGAQVSLTDSGFPPVTVYGRTLTGIKYHSPVASAQVKTATILAGLQAKGITVVSEDVQSRDHTERMLSTMGAQITIDGNTIQVQRSELSPLGDYTVPGDLSSAAFLLAAGLICDGPGVTVNHVGINPSRTGFLDAVQSMGANIDIFELESDGEPVANLTAHRAELTPLILGGEGLVRAIDEVPILAVLATQANGRSVISDAGELRVKESDRISVTANVLNAMGADVTEMADGLIIEGPTPLRSAVVQTHHDHRIAMAAAIAGLTCGVTIEGASVADVSFPGFYSVLEGLKVGG